MTSFTNPIVPPDQMPEIRKEDFQPVDPKYLRLIYYRIAITFLFMGAALAFLLLVSDEGWPPALTWILAGFILFISVYSLIISKLSFPYRGYLIREKDLSYKRGLLTFKLSSIPYKRIQHVELNQGVLAKRMGLASIKIFTAGGSSDDLSIPGLPIETAKQIRAFLTEKISSGDIV